MSEHTGGERESLAPVTPLFPRRGQGAPRPGPDPSAWHPTWTGIDRDDEDEHDDLEDGVVLAERMLLRRLRTRSLSIREAEAALYADGLSDAEIAGVIRSFRAQGYLDDHALAEQLIDKAVSRKAQGRQAIAQTLAQRGIPRDVADAAISALPDDEFERALEFARSGHARPRPRHRAPSARRSAGPPRIRRLGADRRAPCARRVDPPSARRPLRLSRTVVAACET